MFKKTIVGIILFLMLAFPFSAWAFSNLVSFGDSLSDNGISVYPVRDMEGFVQSSNGWVWVNYLAQNLGIAHDGRAYSGALSGLGNVLSETPDEFGLLWQVDNYSPAGNISNTLFTVWAGGNDLLGINNPDNAGTVITGAINNIGAAISVLYGLGARNIMVPNLPDLGIIPKNYGDPVTSPLATQISQIFNGGLDTLITSLGQNPGLSGLTLYKLDIFSFLNSLPSGSFTNTTDQWILSGGADAATYLFFDGIHPTTRGHQMIAEFAVASMMPEAVPVPGAVWMLGSGLIFIMGIRRKA